MSFVNPATPNLADFQTFCQAQGVQPGFLPLTSSYYQWALTHAIDVTPYVSPVPAIEYVIAVYNYGMHWLVSNASDVTGLGISTIAWTSNTVLVTASAALGFPVGQSLPVVMGAVIPLAYNGAYTTAVIGASQFAYELDSNPGTVTNLGVFGYSFFADLRAKFNILSLVAGPIQTSADQGTSQTRVVPDFFKTVTLGDLDLMKTPWGQRYLAYAQKAGPTVVGVS